LAEITCDDFPVLIGDYRELRVAARAPLPACHCLARFLTTSACSRLYFRGKIGVGEDTNDRIVFLPTPSNEYDPALW